MVVRLKNLNIRGFKTIRELKGFDPGPLNVMIGENGAGKSNFISFFRLLRAMLTPPGNLQQHVGECGGANALLHDGARVTRDIEARLTLETGQGYNDYEFRLAYAAADTLVFTEEKYRFSDRRFDGLAGWTELGAGHREAKLVERAEGGEHPASTILSSIRKCVVYQFHNTSMTARMRGKWSVNDAKYLKEDGGNIAAFLLRLREHEPKYYRRIVETIRSIVPFFADFELESEYEGVILKWRERDTDIIFNASQASDGMLRLMALVALLCQPKDNLPAVLLLDEPELGLHPYGIEVVAGLFKSVSEHVQVLVATQSPTLVNYFEPGDIVVVDREGRETSFTRHPPEKLADWLEEYSMAELWEKNVLGGIPSR